MDNKQLFILANCIRGYKKMSMKDAYAEARRIGNKLKFTNKESALDAIKNYYDDIEPSFVTIDDEDAKTPQRQEGLLDKNFDEINKQMQAMSQQINNLNNTIISLNNKINELESNNKSITIADVKKFIEDNLCVEKKPIQWDSRKTIYSLILYWKNKKDNPYDIERIWPYFFQGDSFTEYD